MMGFKPIPTVIAVVITLLIWFAVPIPQGVSLNAWHMLALFVGVIAAIIGKAMPIGALSIIGITIVAISQVTVMGEPNADQAIKDALSSFANPLIWLIGVSVMISRGILKTGLGIRMGYFFIYVWGKSSLGIGYSLAISELILAPVTPSNTARGGGIIHPVMRSIAHAFNSDPEQGTEKKIGRYLALVNYQCNPVTSAMFVTATASNPLVVNLVADATGNHVNLTWSMWAWGMLVPGLVALTLVPLVVYWLSPPEIKRTPDARTFAKENLKAMGPMKANEWIMLVVFGVMLLFWADIPALLIPGLSLNATTVAFLGLSIALFTGVLTWEDVLKEKSAWDTVVWFSALVMMATFLSKLGLIKVISTLLGTSISHLGLGWQLECLILIAVYIYSHYIFASTTAHVSAMFAAFYAAGLAIGVPPVLLAFLMISSSGVMMSITHYASGTAPVIFNSGYVTLGQWWRVGFVLSVINMIIFTVIGAVWWKVLGYW